MAKKHIVASSNIDRRTVDGFGEEWAAFDQRALGGDEYAGWFDAYFGIFPFATLNPDAEGFDLGCGSGRWAAGVAPKVGRLHCIDPAQKALDVARRRLNDTKNVDFHMAASDAIPLADNSQDFGYSLGVLHHIPDTARALGDAVSKLKPGAPFLVYLYYALDGRPAWFRGLWLASDSIRRGVVRLPFAARKVTTTVMAGLVYWPLARGARLAERMGMDVAGIPLSAYRHGSFYTMRTDALDRFGTKLEQRFTREQIQAMMLKAGLQNIRFSDKEPFWVACGVRAPS